MISALGTEFCLSDLFVRFAEKALFRRETALLAQEKKQLKLNREKGYT
jgi:hypothetical protein